MDWMIGKRIFNGRNASWWRNVLLAAVLGVAGCSPAPKAGQSPVSTKEAPPVRSPAATDVADCRPCRFSPGGDAGVYSFTFDVQTSAAGRSVQAIDVTSDKSEAKQRLEVKDMDPIGTDEKIFFGGADVNFDGYQDLMIITSRGVANAYAMYWLFDPASGQYRPLGNYPVFQLDAAGKKLKSYERGGSGGLIYDAKEYAFENGNLVLTHEEKQDATAKPDVFKKVTSERVNDAMKVVKTETVKAPQ